MDVHDAAYECNESTFSFSNHLHSVACCSVVGLMVTSFVACRRALSNA